MHVASYLCGFECHLSGVILFIFYSFKHLITRFTVVGFSGTMFGTHEQKKEKYRNRKDGLFYGLKLNGYKQSIKSENNKH